MCLALGPRSRVDPNLPEDQGPVTCQVLEPGEVPAECSLALQEHVEREEVQLAEREVLRGRVVGIRDQAPRVARLDLASERVDPRGCTVGADPSDHVCGEFVADRDAEDPVIASQACRFPTHLIACVAQHLTLCRAR